MKLWGALLVVGMCVVAEAAAPRPGRNAAPNADAAYVNTLIAQGDKQSLSEAAKSIGELIETQPTAAVYPARSSWLPALMGAGMYDDVQRLATATMVEVAYDGAMLEELQRLRIRAYLLAGQSDRALSAARGLFDISSMATTRAALTQLAECLSAAHPLDAAAANRLRLEQQRGAASADAVSQSLLEIPVDADRWQPALLRYDPERYTIRSSLYRNLVARGNVLLLCGRAAEAKSVFERAKAVADDDSVLQANENIARAIKAQHGCTGPANEFVRELKR